MELRKEYVKNINKIKAYDIFPENKNIIKEDFLKLENNNIIENINEKNILVVGGPPFSNSLSVKFFNKSAEIANVIAFVMPRSFKKQSMVNKLDKRFHLENTIDLDEKSFTFGDKTVNKACIFQIWVKKDKNRPIPNKEIPNSNYYFIDKIKKNEKNFEKYKDNIISIERVGSKAGSCRKYKNYNNESKESRLFIVLKDNNIITNMIEYLNKIKWEYNNIGQKSVSKYELIKYINLYYET